MHFTKCTGVLSFIKTLLSRFYQDSQYLQQRNIYGTRFKCHKQYANKLSFHIRTFALTLNLQHTVAESTNPCIFRAWFYISYASKLPTLPVG